MDRSNFWPMQLFQTGPHFNQKRFGSETIFFRLHITDLKRMFGAAGNQMKLGKVSFTWWVNFWTIYIIGKGEKGNCNIVLVGKWSISYLKVESILITEDFLVTAPSTVAQRKLKIWLNLSWNIQFWIAMCRKFYCMTWQNSY